MFVRFRPEFSSSMALTGKQNEVFVCRSKMFKYSTFHPSFLLPSCHRSTLDTSTSGSSVSTTNRSENERKSFDFCPRRSRGEKTGLISFEFISMSRRVFQWQRIGLSIVSIVDAKKHRRIGSRTTQTEKAGVTFERWGNRRKVKRTSVDLPVFISTSNRPSGSLFATDLVRLDLMSVSFVRFVSRQIDASFCLLMNR